MAWQADQIARKTFDPESGLEIVSAKEHREERSVLFRIEGPGTAFSFRALSSYLERDSDELRQLGLPDAGLWTVLSYPEDEESMAVIAAALTAFRYSSGYSLRDIEFFVRFGKDGEIL